MSTIELRNGTPFQRTVLSNMLRFKALPHSTQGEPNNDPVEVKTQDICVTGFIPSALYLDTKYPIPQLIRNGAEDLAITLMITERLETEHEETKIKAHIHDLTETTDPFILGDRISLLDMLVIPFLGLVKNPRYGEALRDSLQQWNSLSLHA